MSKMTFPTRAEKRLPVEVLRQLLEYDPVTGEYARTNASLGLL